MLKAAQKIVPPLLPQFHKGQLGRILVVGGSEDYTGAPYFAAMASALAGADMSHILCTEGAAPVIKGYSPNLMVHPYLSEARNDLNSKVESLLDRMHVILIGPGLGRDPAIFRQIKEIVKLSKSKNLPLVIDADGLYFVQEDLDIVSAYTPNRVILTPNVVEFSRLIKSAHLDKRSDKLSEQAELLAQKLKCVILMKGSNDLITDGSATVENTTEGSLRRVSGQGDTLSGSLATFVAWTEAYSSKLWKVDPIPEDSPQNLLILAAWAASAVTRTASKLAYREKKRSMVTTDVNGRVGEAFEEVFGIPK